jgi:hypothetical protein
MTELAPLIANCSFIQQTVLLLLQDKTCFLQEKNFPSAPHAPLHCYSHGLLSLSLSLSHTTPLSITTTKKQLQQQQTDELLLLPRFDSNGNTCPRTWKKLTHFGLRTCTCSSPLAPTTKLRNFPSLLEKN